MASRRHRPPCLCLGSLRASVPLPPSHRLLLCCCVLVCCYAVMRCPYFENMRPVSVLFVGIGHFPPLSSLCPIPTKLRATTKKSPFPECPKMSPVVCTKNAIFRVCKPTLQRFPPRLACLQLHHRYSPLSRTPVCLYDVHSLVCTTYTEVSRLDLSLHLPKLALQKAEALLLSCEGTSWSCWSIVVATAYV